MIAKLAFRNIKRSFKDYAIYFITLIFGVAVFYAFNSIGSQQVLFDLQADADARQFEMTEQMLSMFSGVVACVLGFLIIYANRFLIKRRKGEFGTYLLLGMKGASVSAIVLMETVLVGLVSLAVGLLAGVVVSQALSFVTASLFGTIMSHYTFVFSADAFVQTLVCFAIIFAVVAVFNTLSVNRLRLIDLLKAGESNEHTAVRNPWVCLVAFIGALVILAYAYEQLIESGMLMLDDPRFLRATVGMLAGTLLLFWSLAGFTIAVLVRWRGLYLRKLAMFTVRQVASKVNTAFLSLWAVCVLLFFSITTFSTGMGLVEVFAGDLEEANPYSASLVAQVWYGPGGVDEGPLQHYGQRREEMAAEAPERLAQADAWQWSAADVLRAGAPELWDETVVRWEQIELYEVPQLTYADLAATAQQPLDMGLWSGSIERQKDTNVMVASVSDANAIAALSDQPTIDLQEGQAALVNNMAATEDLARAYASAEVTLNIGEAALALQNAVYPIQLEDMQLLASAMLIVVPDEVIDWMTAQGAIPDQSFLNVQYADNGKTDAENDSALATIVAATQPLSAGGFEKGFAGSNEPYASLLWPVTSIISRASMMSQASGIKMLTTYLALYIGFVFLVSTAAILAIQQLSEASDSLPRYRTLSRLGCDRSMINRSLLAQVLIYFLLPLGVAACHSACAVSVLSGELYEALGVSVVEPIAWAALLVVIIYGTYLLVTYLASRAIVSSALRA